MTNAKNTFRMFVGKYLGSLNKSGDNIKMKIKEIGCILVLVAQEHAKL
jgi:hypothetical protein